MSNCMRIWTWLEARDMDITMTLRVDNESWSEKMTNVSDNKNTTQNESIGSDQRDTYPY